MTTALDLAPDNFAMIIDASTFHALRRKNSMWFRAAKCLILFVFLSAQALQGKAQESGCGSISRENMTTLKLDWYSVAPISGGTALPVELEVDEAYIYRPMFALGGPNHSTALFEMNYISGRPVSFDEQIKPMKTGHLMVLMTAHGYARPEYSLGAISGAPVGPPLTWPDYHKTGSMLGDFWEIRVEDQADYYRENFDIAAEFAPDGSMTALLSCRKATPLFKNPTCSIRETVRRWGTDTSFLRSDLDALPEVRQRVKNFISCIDKGVKN